jgi:basic membrane lipoprotein Med (substrate-binding protein (PBP1-ABC) superfamily)
MGLSESTKRFDDPIAIVIDRVYSGHFEAGVGEFGGQPGGVRIDDFASGYLGSCT